MLAFDPAIDNITTLSNPQQARAGHQIANVPIFAGTNAQEGRVFVLGRSNLTAFLATTFPQSAELHEAIAAA